MMANTYTFRSAITAFEHAIRTGSLSNDPFADHFVGHYMYMGTKSGQDMFKHKMTRQYLMVQS